MRVPSPCRDSSDLASSLCFLSNVHTPPKPVVDLDPVSSAGAVSSGRAAARRPAAVGFRGR